MFLCKIASVSNRTSLLYGNCDKIILLLLGNLSIKESLTGRAGLKSTLMISCQACGENIQMETSKNIAQRGKSF